MRPYRQVSAKKTAPITREFSKVRKRQTDNAQSEGSVKVSRPATPFFIKAL